MGYIFDPLVFSGLIPTSGGGDGHYKAPVPLVSDLPTTASPGDVRVVLATDEIFVYDGPSSRWVNVGLRSALVGSTPNANGYTLIFDNTTPNVTFRELKLEPADPTNPGVVTTGSQSFGGNKTIVGVGGGQVDALTLTSSANTDLIIKNTGAGSNGLLVGNSGGATANYQIANLDSGQFHVTSAGGVYFHSPVDLASHLITNVSDPTAPQDAMTLNYADNTYIPLSQKAAALGVASLDAGGKVPLTQLPNSIMEYQGNYDASTNTPILSDGIGHTGDVWRVNVAGAGVNSLNFVVGDFAIYNGSVWQKAHAGADAVLSVNSYSGIVNLSTTDIPEGTNLYFTNARVVSAQPSSGINGAIQLSNGSSGFTSDAPDLSFNTSTKILTVSPGQNGTAAAIGNGAFISGFSGDGFLGAGAMINNGAWVATQTSHANSYFQAAGGAGQYNIFTDTGLSPGSGFNPSLRFSVGPTGATNIYSNSLNMNSHNVINVANPTSPQDAATKAYVDAATPTGPINTIARFNGTGNLTGSSVFTFNANNSVTIGAGSLSVGSAQGAMVRGYAANDTMVATGDGSLTSGYLFNGASGTFPNAMAATGTGAHILGTADDGQMYATNIGSIALGAAYAGSSGTPKLESTGAGSIAMGLSISNGVMTSSGSGSIAAGCSNGGNSNGTLILSSGNGSLAGGYALLGANIIASGDGSLSHGSDLNTSAKYGQSFGQGHVNNTLATFVVGQYSVTPTANQVSYSATDPMFVVGNGTSTGARNNAFQIRKDGTQFVKDPTLSGASVGWVRSLVNTSTGEAAWTAPSSATNKKDLYTLSSTDITNQYVDLTQVAKTDSILFMVKGAGSQVEGAAQDYTVNYTGGAGGKTRITFVNGLATGGISALVAGDVVVAKYQY